MSDTITHARAARRSRRHRGFAVTALAGLLALQGCGLRNPPPTNPDDLAEYKEANDPYEPLNRKMYGVEMFAYRNALHPIARAYVWAVPRPVRHALGNLVQTMNEPVVFFSDVGAGKPRRAGDAFMRYAINLTAGVGGLFDVAHYLGYDQPEGDPGLTLATWGVPSGPYLFLPGPGPSSLRDGAGMGIAIGLQPLNYIPRGFGLLTFYTAYSVIGTVGGIADNMDAFDQVQQDALDPYATIRSGWQQNRQAQVKAIRADHRATVPDWFN